VEVFIVVAPVKMVSVLRRHLRAARSIMIEAPFFTVTSVTMVKVASSFRGVICDTDLIVDPNYQIFSRSFEMPRLCRGAEPIVDRYSAEGRLNIFHDLCSRSRQRDCF